MTMEPVIPSAQTLAHLEFGNLTSLYICIHQNIHYIFYLDGPLVCRVKWYISAGLIVMW
jgi:hypothetical protein